MRFKNMVILLGLGFFIQSCGQGPQGIPGPAGSSGASGQSVVGPAGADGTQITMVQFCSGVTSYPTTFAEAAECISENLYAVYWDGKNAWLTLIPPGQYSSTSTSLPCSFTVLPNCVIQN